MSRHIERNNSYKIATNHIDNKTKAVTICDASTVVIRENIRKKHQQNASKLVEEDEEEEPSYIDENDAETEYFITNKDYIKINFSKPTNTHISSVSHSRRNDTKFWSIHENFIQPTKHYSPELRTFRPICNNSNQNWNTYNSKKANRIYKSISYPHRNDLNQFNESVKKQNCQLNEKLKLSNLIIDMCKYDDTLRLDSPLHLIIAHKHKQQQQQEKFDTISETALPYSLQSTNPDQNETPSCLINDEKFDTYKTLFGIFSSTALTFCTFNFYLILQYLIHIDKPYILAFNVSSFLISIFASLLILTQTCCFENITQNCDYIFINNKWRISKFYTLITITCFIYATILVSYGYAYMTHVYPAILLPKLYQLDCLIAILNGVFNTIFLLLIISYLKSFSKKILQLNKAKMSNKFILSLIYVVFLQINYFYTACILYCLIYLLNENVLYGLFNHICIKSINVLVNCYSFIGMEKAFKSKISVHQYVPKRLVKNFTTNSTTSAMTTTIYEFNYLQDVYLFLFCITFIGLFVSIAILVMFKAVAVDALQNKFIKKRVEAVTFNNAPKQTEPIRQEYLIIQMVLPVVFGHSFIRTVLIQELNKWNVSCMKSPFYFVNILLCYGFGSFATILCIIGIYLLYNVKRNLLFSLTFLQQLTLFILLIFWNPQSDLELTNYSIHLIFIICFSMCDNLWIAHNLNAIFGEKASMRTILQMSLYGLAMFTLGTIMGLAVNTYFCFMVKMLLAILIFISTSITYLTPTIVNLILDKQKLLRIKRANKKIIDASASA